MFCLVKHTHVHPCVVQVVVNGDENSVVLRYLNSLTEYQITVFAIYSNSASEALRGSETTCECSV